MQEGTSPADIRSQLRQRHGIHVWVSPLTSTRVGMVQRGLDSVVRSSVHYYNTAEEIERLIEAARQL